jgi:cyanophycin synthetase
LINSDLLKILLNVLVSHPVNLTNVIHQHAQSRPHDLAIIGSKARFSWALLDQLIWSCAQKFSLHGIRAGQRVGLCMAQPVIHLIASLALARMGAAHVAIPISEPAERRRRVVDQLALAAVVCDVAEIRAMFDHGIDLSRLPTDTPRPDQLSQLVSQDGDLPWLILQSSGTTGEPKFAELTHALALHRHARFSAMFNPRPDDIFWAASRPDFVVSKQRLTFSLMSGAAVCIPLDQQISTALLGFLNQNRITMACGTPSHMNRLIQLDIAMPSLRLFEARSAMIGEELRHQFKDRINPNLYVVYGTNEGDGLAMASPSLQSAAPDTVGTAAPGIAIQIVDAQDAGVPAFQTGRVRVSGPGLVCGYLNREHASRQAFKDGWFYPGDLGYLTDQGALILQGREDDMMIYDGMNIYPAEIERALDSHPCVDEVAAFSLRHPVYQETPVAAVTLKHEISETELIQHCQKQLGIKSPHVIFRLKELPKNPAGKILKRHLASIAAKLIHPSSSTP